jgi:hypothetical protein
MCSPSSGREDEGEGGIGVSNTTTSRSASRDACLQLAQPKSEACWCVSWCEPERCMCARLWQFLLTSCVVWRARRARLNLRRQRHLPPVCGVSKRGSRPGARFSPAEPSCTVCSAQTAHACLRVTHTAICSFATRQQEESTRHCICVYNSSN